MKLELDKYKMITRVLLKFFSTKITRGSPGKRKTIILQDILSVLSLLYAILLWADFKSLVINLNLTVNLIFIVLIFVTFSKLFKFRQNRLIKKVAPFLKLENLFFLAIFILFTLSFLDINHQTGSKFLLLINQSKNIIGLVCFTLGIFFISNRRSKLIEGAEIEEIFAKESTVNKNSFTKKIKGCLKKEKPYLIIVSAVIIVLFLSTLPLLKDFISGDEWHLYNLAKTITETGQLETEWNFFYNKPDFEYKQETLPSLYLAGWFFIFGEKILVAHLSSFFIAMLFLFLSYFFISKFLNKKIAILFILYFATTPFFVIQSIYIRGYVWMLLFSIVLYWIIIKIAFEKNIKKFLFLALISFFISYLLKDIRIFGILFIFPTLFFLLFNLTNRLPKKIQKGFLFFYLISISLLFIFQSKIISLVTKFIPIESLIKPNISFSLVGIERSIFNLNPIFFLVSLGLSFALFIFLFKLTKKKKIVMPEYFRNLFVLLVILIIFHLAYGTTPRESLLIPRYMIILLPLNFIVILGILFPLFEVKLKNKRNAFFLFLTIILSLNLFFWKTDDLNGWSNGYNFTDIYNRGDSTSRGRIKEKAGIMYQILEKEFSKEENQQIALLTEYYADPRMKKISSFSAKIDLIALRYLAHKTHYVKVPYNDYLQIARNPISEEYIKKIIDEFDSVYIIFQTRKDYKFENQLISLNNLSFNKISGEYLDNSGIEIFRYSKHSN